ncbi:hypothetical protein BJV74DRAFT_881587 [Russula compacta]|nr:hypothetical protein BJV74DRAFT_881587 [Russula compacta]
MAQVTDLRQVIFINHPKRTFLSIATILAFFALSPTPSFIPLTILVATLLVYTRIVLPRPHAPRIICGASFAVSLASTLSHLMPSIHALSSTTSSIVSLWIISSLSSFVAFGIVMLSDRLSCNVNVSSTKITLFPTLWATIWQIISHTSPIGHLVTWSPVTGIASYEWMRPLFGPWGLNWVVGAWAVVIAEVVGAWFIGPGEEFEPHGPLIPSLVSNSEPPPRKLASLPRPRPVLLLSTVLLILTTPPFFSRTISTSPWSTSSTPLSVACILPHPLSADDGNSPLNRFIAESRQHSGARLLLWPEGALRFDTIAQREEAINRVRNEVKGPLVGITFTEPVPPSAEWSHSQFYKRNLVPIAESFSLTESKNDPEIYELELRGSNKNKKWTPAPPYQRTIPLTAAICLDFSSPTLFTSLDSRPALILAPARTWHRDVSASGVAGHGLREPVQFGSGSWTRTIGVEWPFDQRRTVYMWGGEVLQAGIVWLLLGAGWATEVLVLRGGLGGAGGAAIAFSRWREILGRAREYIRRPAPVQGEQQPLLQ